jgi:glycosyltransferase involved in cell wall biosynthesis
MQAELFASRLKSRGAEVLVLTHGPPAADTKGVRIAYLTHSDRRGVLATLRRNVSIMRQVSAVFREFRPDVVQTQTAAGLFPLIVGVAARRRGTPSWVKFAANPVLEYRHRRSAAGWKGRITAATVRALASLVFRLHRYVWVTTPLMAQSLGSEWGIAPDRIVVQPNLVQFQPAAVAANRRPQGAAGEGWRLLIVGRLEAIKGVDVAIRALSELRDTPAVLRIVGEGDPSYTAALHRLASELGVAHRIEWAGKVVGEALRREYGEADLLVVPSRYEAFGSVLVEAMAAGLPIVASRVGGIPDVVQHGECARLVEPEDAQALARAIEDLVEDPRELTRLSAAGLERARDFDAEAGVDKWLEIYREHVTEEPQEGARTR